MGVTYKLREEVVRFIISQRQDNPLFSCRQLAESASQKFGLHLSKSSVHDVLKESGIVTPRGRKPKNRFAIPQEKKQQIQTSLSQVKLLPENESDKFVILNESDKFVILNESDKFVILSEAKDLELRDMEISGEYEKAGRIFQKAVLWDLGIFSEENLKESDWPYYLTYCKGTKVVLENNKEFFIDLPLPVERCIRETVDGLVNNVKPLIVYKVSDEALFKACMNAEAGFNIKSVAIVDHNDHILLEFINIMERKRYFIEKNRIFVDNNEKELIPRIRKAFFTQSTDNIELVNNILNLKGFDSKNKEENIVTLLIENTYDNKTVLQKAVEKLNGMCLYDEQNRLVRVKIQEMDSRFPAA